MQARHLHTPRRDAAPVERKSPCVWAFGGGKGGVGKSVVASSLAVAFAERGHSCALVDADLGGANVHTVLGMHPPARTLSHFIEGEVATLAETLAPTPIPNLSIVSGARSMLDIANLSHPAKLRLLRHIHRLPVDHVFLDLSAGSAYNALDLFLEAHRTLLVVVPEPTSVENAYHFLKAAFFRSLKVAIRHSKSRAEIQRSLGARVRGRIRSPRDLISRVAEIDPDTARLLQERLARFRPMLIVNQARTPEHRSLGRKIREACESYLDCEVSYLGAIERDDCVNDALRRGRPVLKLHPGSRFSLDLEKIASQLMGESIGSGAAATEEFAPAHRLSPNLYNERYFATHGEPEEKPRAPAARPVELPPKAAPGVGNPGAHLRHWRERLGLALQDLCHHTRIRSLEHIESERFGELPPPPYLQGFVRQYAQALGLHDGDAIAASFVARYQKAMCERV